MWSVGRHDLSSPFALVLETPPNNDTALVTGDQTPAFIIVGDYTFITRVASGTWTVSKTNDQTNYTTSSIYESKIFNTGQGAGSSLVKDLVGVTVTTESLPIAGRVRLDYAIDNNIGGGSWTNILDETTDNSISFSSITGLAKEYKEIQFRIRSTGNAEITSLSFKEEVVGKRNYE